MKLVDSHCHLQDSEFFAENREQAYRESIESEVAMMLIGTDLRSSREAIAFSASHAFTYAVVGIHPHEATKGRSEAISVLIEQNHDKIYGIGEIGLDYYYLHSPREVQIKLLNEQLQLAQDYKLPVSFHARDAYDDFWPIFSDFRGISGVLHSYTDNSTNLTKALSNGLKIGVNGISTFTKVTEQQELFRELPLEDILLETDAPFLTPRPIRGKMNIPANVELVAAHQAAIKGVDVDEVRAKTTANAIKLFNLPL